MLMQHRYFRIWICPDSVTAADRRPLSFAKPTFESCVDGSRVARVLFCFALSNRITFQTDAGGPTNGLSLMFPQAPGGAIRPLGFRARGRGA